MPPGAEPGKPNRVWGWSRRPPRPRPNGIYPRHGGGKSETQGIWGRKLGAHHTSGENEEKKQDFGSKEPRRKAGAPGKGSWRTSAGPDEPSRPRGPPKASRRPPGCGRDGAGGSLPAGSGAGGGRGPSGAAATVTSWRASGTWRGPGARSDGQRRGRTTARANVEGKKREKQKEPQKRKKKNENKDPNRKKITK